MNQEPRAATAAAKDTQVVPVLFHDGCNICLDIAVTLNLTVPGLRIVDLGLQPQFTSEAMARGVEQLPSLVVGAKVLLISPHSDIAHIGA